MRKLVFLLLVSVLTLLAANFKLYLKDGSFQIVREYKIDGDRLRYYSIDRSDWEELPVALVDLKRTDAEMATRKSEIDKQQREVDEEKAAEREAYQELMKIPRDPGVYRLENDQLRIFKAAEATLHNAKGRKVLKVLTPLPVVSDKATLEIPGEHSTEVVKDNSPEFFIQLSEFESFGIVKLTPQKGVRIVERITVQPITKENTEDRDKVEIFTQQLSDNGLFKIWPQDPLQKGEYAVIEYTDGKINTQTWDFSIE